MVEPSRREKLEAMLASDPDDSFLMYGVAMEYVREGDAEEGLKRLQSLTEKDPDYQAAYFQIGQLLVQQGEVESAKAWLTRGIAAARRIGDVHAAEEMTGFLQSF